MKRTITILIGILILTIFCASCEAVPGGEGSAESSSQQQATEVTSTTPVKASEQVSTTTSTKAEQNKEKNKKTTTVKTTTPKTTTTKRTTTVRTTTKPVTTTAGSSEVTWSRASSYESQILNGINDKRKALGLDPFKECSSCKKSAVNQAKWNAEHLVYGQLSHHGVKQCGAESNSATYAVTGWFESPAHRQTMTKTNVAGASIACYKVIYPDRGTRYCVIFNLHNEGFSCTNSVDMKVPTDWLR